MLKWAYNKTIRPYLPRKLGVFNGVAVRRLRLLDTKETFESYEIPLVRAIRASVNRGDDVIVVGGGYGVSTVTAARQTGETGHVHVYEASAEYVDLTRETVHLNDVSDRVAVSHAAVGPQMDVWGSVGEPDTIKPADLPDADVLVLDCEGAEAEILDGYRGDPHTIIVEVHPHLGVSECGVRVRLTTQGYSITERKVEVDPGNDREMPVLTATKK